MLLWRRVDSVPIYWPIWWRETGATEIYTCVTAEILVSLFLATFPSGHITVVSLKNAEKTQFALISWFLFLRYRDQCCVVNYYSCKSLKSYAGLEMHVDDTLGVISLINWRCHHSEFWRNVWRIEKSASSFSHFKSHRYWISAVYFSD